MVKAECSGRAFVAERRKPPGKSNTCLASNTGGLAPFRFNILPSRRASPSQFAEQKLPSMPRRVCSFSNCPMYSSFDE